MYKLLSILMVAVAISAFTKKSTKEFTPPGTVKINDSLFMDNQEVSNFAWKEYEQWTKTKYGKNSPQHLATLPDTLVWREKLAYNEPYVVYYYQHPAYKDYPVVGISYGQAIAYCNWRTDRVKELLSVSKKNVKLNFEYRLPSKQEWEFCSNNGAGIFESRGFDKNHHALVNCIFEPDTVLNTMNDGADVTAPVSAYYKNHFGIYNMIGNVAEMIQEQGICKGGGWSNLLEECRVGKDTPYSKPTSWLGFRCVCVKSTAHS